jgi:hypothetical protein
MAFTHTVPLVVNDTLPNIVYTIVDQNTDTPVNLTGSTVRLRIREIGSSTEKAVLVCAEVDMPNGQVSSNFPSGVLDTAGTFEGELEVTFPSGVQTTYDKVKFIVRSQVG